MKWCHFQQHWWTQRLSYWVKSEKENALIYGIWKEMIQMNLFTKQTDSQTWRTKLWLVGGRWGEGIIVEFQVDMQTLLYLKWITNEKLLYSTWNSVQCYVAAWVGGEWGRMNTCICIWLSNFAVHLKPLKHY